MNKRSVRMIQSEVDLSSNLVVVQGKSSISNKRTPSKLWRVHFHGSVVYCSIKLYRENCEVYITQTVEQFHT